MVSMREIGVYWYLFSNHCTRECIHKKLEEGAAVARRRDARAARDLVAVGELGHLRAHVQVHNGGHLVTRRLP